MHLKPCLLYLPLWSAARDAPKAGQNQEGHMLATKKIPSDSLYGILGSVLPLLDTHCIDSLFQFEVQYLLLGHLRKGTDSTLSHH